MKDASHNRPECLMLVDSCLNRVPCFQYLGSKLGHPRKRRMSGCQHLVTCMGWQFCLEAPVASALEWVPAGCSEERKSVFTVQMVVVKWR